MRDYCDAQAGFWLNSKFLSKFSSLPLSGIEDQNTPPPISENFRFGMTKVYSGIPPPFRKTSDLGWPKFTLEYPLFPPPPSLPNGNCQRVQVRDFQNTESYYMWRLYPTRITTSFCILLTKVKADLNKWTKAKSWPFVLALWQALTQNRHYPVKFYIKNKIGLSGTETSEIK